jgi:hypothetical protein
MEMEVQPTQEGACAFEGEADLGIWGSYRCEGEADGTNFTARYSTKFDRGVFEMMRVE